MTGFDFLVNPINLIELKQAINRYRAFVKRNNNLEKNRTKISFAYSGWRLTIYLQKYYTHRGREKL
jgi:hypothetical protein